MLILEENFKWHKEAFASELYKYSIYMINPAIVLVFSLASVKKSQGFTSSEIFLFLNVA